MGKTLLILTPMICSGMLFLYFSLLRFELVIEPVPLRPSAQNLIARHPFSVCSHPHPSFSYRPSWQPHGKRKPYAPPVFIFRPVNALSLGPILDQRQGIPINNRFWIKKWLKHVFFKHKSGMASSTRDNNKITLPLKVFYTQSAYL